MNQPKYVDKIVLMKKSTLEITSPFKDISVGFNWVNTEYPIYHDHTHWELLIIMHGQICHNINGVESVLEKGDVCLIRPKDRHSLYFQKGQEKCQQMNLFFSDEFAKQFFQIYGCYDKLLHEKKDICFQLDNIDISGLYDNALLAQNLSEELYEMSSKLMLSEVMLKYLKKNILNNHEFPAWLNEFIVYINNPVNFEQPIKELAKSTPYSYSRLATLFKQYVGETLIDYINEKKMRYARRMLRTTKLTTLQISEMIGYTSLSSFNHSFKKEYGITPSEYRKKNR